MRGKEGGRERGGEGGRREFGVNAISKKTRTERQSQTRTSTLLIYAVAFALFLFTISVASSHNLPTKTQCSSFVVATAAFFPHHLLLHPAAAQEAKHAGVPSSAPALTRPLTPPSCPHPTICTTGHKQAATSNSPSFASLPPPSATTPHAPAHTPWTPSSPPSATPPPPGTTPNYTPSNPWPCKEQVSPRMPAASPGVSS